MIAAQTQAAPLAAAAAAPRPHLYDLAEGYGSVYGRYVRNHLSRRLAAEYGVRSVLEAPCNAEAYFVSPGTQSVVFAEEGCSVSLLHADGEVVRQTREFWAALGQPDTPVIHHTDLYRLPFEPNRFNLVWNFDHIPLFDDPVRFIAEMARVSDHLVLVIIPNGLNIGYPVHALFTRLAGRKSLWGDWAWMARKPVVRAMRRAGLKIVETGLVDMPPWPGFDAANLIGQLVRRKTIDARPDERSDADIEQMLSKLTFIEYAPLPELFKLPFSHQIYILAEKPQR